MEDIWQCPNVLTAFFLDTGDSSLGSYFKCYSSLPRMCQCHTLCSSVCHRKSTLCPLDLIFSVPLINTVHTVEYLDREILLHSSSGKMEKGYWFLILSRPIHTCWPCYRFLNIFQSNGKNFPSAPTKVGKNGKNPGSTWSAGNEWKRTWILRPFLINSINSMIDFAE